MPPGVPEIESLIQIALTSRLKRDAFDQFCNSHNVTFDELCNAVAIAVARRFDDSGITFEDGDRVMNALSGLMINHLTQQAAAQLPEPAWSIYLAFDAGEYDQHDGADPVERFTKPFIKKILRDA